MRSSFTRASLSLIVWVSVLAAASVTIVSLTSNEKWLKSNVFELLPAADYDPLTEIATQTVDNELGTRLLFFVGHSDRELAKAAAEALGEQMLGHPLIASVKTRVDEDQYSTIASFYHPYRRQILSQRQLSRVIEDAPGVERSAIATMYSPLGGGSSLATDPFFLLADSLQALQPSGTSLNLDDSYLWAERGGRDYIFVMASLTSPTLSIVEQESLAKYLNAAMASTRASEPELDFLKTGFSFYAHEATKSAKGEVSTIGVGSLVGLLLLVVATFRSLRPLSLIVISILSGCLVALAATLAIFGYVHLFTLVFGASLIGVSVDYSFHYVTDDAFGGEDWTPRKGLQNIFMGITLGLLTSILAYLALTVAPFPGLQQLAVFSTAGLIGAYLTLICVSGFWRRRMAVNTGSFILRGADRYLRLWQRTRPGSHYFLIGVLAVIVVFAYQTIEINDDVTVLQAQSVELKRQEAAIQQLLGIAQAGTFLLVSAPSDEELLQLEEDVRSELDGMINTGALTGYQAMSRWVPSRAQQARSYSAYVELIRSRLPAYFESLGVDKEIASNTVAQLSDEMQLLDVETWLAHPASMEFRSLRLDAAGSESASIVLLYGVQDLDGLSAMAMDYPSVAVVNKARELSGLFGQYRARVGQVLAAAYLIILAGLAMRYGLRQAAILLVPPIFAGLLALIVISAMGETLNLFNFLAMILVLGIGIDFTLFLAEARGELTSTIFAITLSALTTMISFGLLALSSTFAVHSFGMTVLVGIACAYLLCPLAISVNAKAAR